MKKQHVVLLSYEKNLSCAQDLECRKEQGHNQFDIGECKTI